MGVAYKTGEVRDIMRSIAIVIIMVLLLLALANVVCAETAPVEEWNKTFGGTGRDWAGPVQQTTDGGYILTGTTRSYGAGRSDFWLVKTDSEGNKEWDKTFGGTDMDQACSVQQTTDGGYIIAGSTRSYGSDWSDFWLVKTDSEGNKEWDKTFGGTDRDWAHAVQQTIDGGYILTGTTRSYGAGRSDFWLVKTDSEGNKEWDKTFGGTDMDQACSVQQTTDGGYIIAGGTELYDAGGGDFWIVKTDSEGNKEWDKTLGGTDWDRAHSVQQTIDGGYILAGTTRSYGAGWEDFWLVKFRIPEQGARLAIPKARFAIESANKIGADTAEAQNLLDKAETALPNNKYQSTIRYTTQAEASAMKSKTKQQDTYAAPLLIAFPIAFVIAFPLIAIKAAANARKRVRREGEEERLQKQGSEEQEVH